MKIQILPIASACRLGITNSGFSALRLSVVRAAAPDPRLSRTAGIAKRHCSSRRRRRGSSSSSSSSTIRLHCSTAGSSSCWYARTTTTNNTGTTTAPFSTSTSTGRLRLWHSALLATAPPRHLLLPQGHPDGSKACTIQALLGDSLLKTAALRELGVGCVSHSSSSVHVSSSVSINKDDNEDAAAAAAELLHEGDITAQISRAVSNKVLAQHATEILVPPAASTPASIVATTSGNTTTMVSAQDISILPTHGRGTAVESAVAMVYEYNGRDDAPIRELARELIRMSRQFLNWKGHLLSHGGSVQSKATGNAAGDGFQATARLYHHRTTSGVWPSKREAEQDAAEEVCRKAGLMPEQQNSDSDDIDEESNRLVEIEQDETYNWKGALLEMGGTVRAVPSDDGFYAESELNGYETTSDVYSSKKAAEQAASRDVLFQNGLAHPSERTAYKLALAKAAMAMSGRIAESQVDADWLKAGHDLLFEQLTVTESAASGGVRDAAWFLRNASKTKSAFGAMILAPMAIPDLVESAFAWGARMGGDGGGDDQSEACVAVALVKAKGQEARWFVSQTQFSMSKARTSIACQVIHELGLIDRAEAEVEIEKQRQNQ